MFVCCWQRPISHEMFFLNTQTKWVQLVAPARNAAAAEIAQRLSRCIFANLNLERRRQARAFNEGAAVVQAHWRGHRLRKAYQAQRRAAVRLQCFWRAAIARQTVRAMKKVGWLVRVLATCSSLTLCVADSKWYEKGIGKPPTLTTQVTALNSYCALFT